MRQQLPVTKNRHNWLSLKQLKYKQLGLSDLAVVSPVNVHSTLYSSAD